MVTSIPSGIGVLSAGIVFAWSVIQFILTRQKELRIHDFDAYHRLIKELVAPDSETAVMWIDRQVAVVYELRHFPRYFPVSYRILSGLREKWLTDQEFQYPRLLREIDLTLAFLKRHAADGNQS